MEGFDWRMVGVVSKRSILHLFCVWGGSCCCSQVLGLTQRCLFSHSLPAFWEMGAQSEELFLCAAVASSLPLSKAVKYRLLQSRSPSAPLDRCQRANPNRRLLSAATVNKTVFYLRRRPLFPLVESAPTSADVPDTQPARCSLVVQCGHVSAQRCRREENFLKNGFQFVNLTAARAHTVLGKAARPTNRSVFPDSLVFGCTVSTRERAACRSLQIHYADTSSPLRLFVNTKSAAVTLCKLGSNFLTALQADTGSGDHSSG